MTRSIRLFLSSTFRDFAEERDLLVKRVFPALRARLRDRFVELLDVDLRWGITAEEAERGEVLPICLAEIDRARPYFICMLGERYGWIPPPEGYAADLLERQPWLRQHQGGKSVTELEILHGVLNNRRMHRRVFFYFRSSAYARSQGGDYLPSAEDRARQTKLKRRIRENGLPVTSYANPEALAMRIERDLWKMLDAEFPATSVPDAFEREQMRHEAYAAPRRRLYLGQERYQAALEAALKAEEPRIIIDGTSGSGKSALLANFFEACRKRHRKYLVHEHYLGASAEAADPHALVRRLIEFIQRATGSTEEIPGEPQKLMDSLPLWLANASAWTRRRKTRFIFVLDSLNSLTAQQDLRWWPAFLPKGITMVVSCLPGPVQDALKVKTEVLPGQDKPPKWKTVIVRPLTRAQSTTLLNTYLARFNKKLPASMVRQVQAHPLAINPLFVRILAEELRLFGVHEQLQKRLDHYLSSQTIGDLFERVLQRVEKDCGEKQVKTAMTAIWASRAGLTEKEILGIAKLTPASWAVIRHALDEALLETSGRMIFAHDHVRMSVARRMLRSSQSKRQAHRDLAAWFSKQPMSSRRVYEEPFQWAKGKAWKELHQVLTAAAFFTAATQTADEEMQLLRYWNLLEQEELLSPGQAYSQVWKRWCKTEPKDSQVLLARRLFSLLLLRGDFSEFSLQVGRYSIDLARECHGFQHPEVAFRLADLGLMLQELNRLEEALSEARDAERLLCKLKAELPVDWAKQMSNVARVLQALGQLDEAAAAFQQSLQILTEEASTDNDQSVAISHNNLAMLLHDQGKLDESKVHYRTALQVTKLASGVASPLYGIFCKNLACLEQDREAHHRALNLLNVASRTLAGSLGPRHIEFGFVESRIGISCYRLERYLEARQHFQIAFEIASVHFTPAHPEYLLAERNLNVVINRLALQAQPGKS